MKIACISTSRVPSNTANSIQVMKACQGLARSGHEVTLLAPAYAGEPSDWEALAEQYGLATPTIGTDFQISWLPSQPALKRNDFAWLAAQQAARQRFDLIYTWTGQSAVFGLARGLPVIFEVHDVPTGALGPLWFRLFLKLRGQKRLLLITRALRDVLAARYGVGRNRSLPAEQVKIAPNGVDLEQYENLPDASTARRALGLPDGVTALCAGHLYAGRGLDLFLGLAGQFPQASFVWVGGRPEDVARARAAAAGQNLRNVTFTGFVSNRALPAYQAAADVLLMPYGRAISGSSGGNSAAICSPMKMFDYLASGRAILSSDLAVIHEVLNERNAVFAPPDDLSGWREALSGLLNDPDLRRRLGDQARKDATGYTWLARAQRALQGMASISDRV